MSLLLQLAFLSVLCLRHGQGWALKRPTQYEQWRELNQLQNRELFLSALQSYFSTKGIQVERTAPTFILTLKNHGMGIHEMHEDQEPVVFDPGMYN